jgi:hypothetical protein
MIPRRPKRSAGNLPAKENAMLGRTRGQIARTACALLALLLILTAPLRAAMAQSAVVNNIKITIEIAGEAVPRFGFIPVRVTVENRQARDLHWDVTFLSESYWTGTPNVAQWTTSLMLPASRTTERWVFVPSFEAGLLNRGYYGAPFSATFDGTGIRSTTLYMGARGRGPMNQMVPWAASPDLQAALRAQIAAFQTAQAPPPASPPARGRRFSPAVFNSDLATIDVTQPLGDWRIWAPFARVVLTEAEYATLPSANRAALRNWVALGGSLYLAPSRSTADAASSREQRVGAGTIVKLDAPLRVDSDLAKIWHDSHAFLAPTLAMPSADQMTLQKSGLSEKIPPAKRVGDWLVYFFIGFALLVGPVNLFGLAPVGRRHRLFITVPLISLTSIAVLLVAIWLQDGVGGTGARRAYVILLPGDNQAAVFQEQVSRSGLLFGTSFALPDDAVCAMVPSDDSNVGAGRTFEYHRQEGRASGDWFRSRARQAQHLRRLIPTRARVEQVGTAPDGAPIVQSSVAATLRDFHYVDAHGNWEANAIPPGTRVTLTRALGRRSPAQRIGEFCQAGSVHFQTLVRDTAQSATGRFVAAADNFDLAPIVTLPEIRWRDSSVLITGMVETGASGNKVAP